MLNETLLQLNTESDTVVARDLKLNFEKFTADGALSPEERWQTVLAVATSLKFTPLVEAARTQLSVLGVDENVIVESQHVAAIMGLLNTYYRFRHFSNDPEAYRTAGLRMLSLSKPVMGKERFELLSLAVSILNGCETCVKAHEKALRELGVSADKIHDVARLTAISKGLATLV